MSLKRALVFGVSGRFLLSMLAVSATVMYALFAGSAVSGLRSAQDILEESTLSENGVFAATPGASFAADDAPQGTTGLWVHGVDSNGTTYATTRTSWPYEDRHVVVLPHARSFNETAWQTANFTVIQGAAPDGAQGSWVLIPPASFDALFPQLTGRATVAVGTGAEFLPAPAVDEFYAKGAEQITSGLAFVAFTSVFVGSVVASVATRLEVLARRSDYALVQAIGAGRLAKRLVAQRALVLVATGAVIGMIVTYALLAYANRTQSRLQLEVPAGYAWLTLASVVIVGSITAAFVGIRTLRGDLAAKLARRGVPIRRFPGPIRFWFVTPRIAAIVAVSVLATTVTIGVILGAVDAPEKLLDPSDEFEVLAGSTGNPLRGSVPRLAAELAAASTGADAVSPEVFAPTVIADHPVMVRGVHPPGWTNLTGGRIVEGRWFQSIDEAVLGVRAQRALDVDIGQTLRVAGSYRAVVHDVVVVGIVQAKTLEDDEVLVPLDTAASLAGLDGRTVHMIRVKGPVNETSDRLLFEGVHVVSLSISPSPPLQGLVATASAEVVNTNPGRASRELTLRVNDEEVETTRVELDGFERETVAFNFTVPATNPIRVEINPSLEADTVPSKLRLRAPKFATVEDGLAVTAFGADGFAASNVTFSTPWQTVTSANGSATLEVQQPGPFRVEARTETAFGGLDVFGTREAWKDEAHLVATRITIFATESIDASTTKFDAIIHVTNLGGRTHDAPVEAQWLDQSASVPSDVGPYASTQLKLSATAPYGRLTVTALGVSGSADLEPSSSSGGAGAPGTPPDSVEEAIAKKRPITFEATETRTQRFLNDVFENLETATTMVLLATAVHGAVVAWVAVRREVVERQSIIRIVNAVGATEGQLRVRAARDAALSTIPGILLGFALVPFAFALGDLAGIPSAFGHRLTPSLSFEVFLRIGAFFMLATVLAAASAVRVTTQQPSTVARAKLYEVMKE